MPRSPSVRIGRLGGWNRERIRESVCISNHTRRMKVFRASEKDPEGSQSWQRPRKGVADLQRRAEISRMANERYLAALAAVDADKTLAEAAAGLCRRTTWQGRSARALDPLADEDARLLEAIHRGEFALQGFHDRDPRSLLYGETDSTNEARRRMAKVTRPIRLLRAHGLVHEVSRTHRYVVSPHGRETIATLLAARQAKAKQLSQLAA